MYLPILRGRQFELIALRELIEKGLIGKYVTPIIEPVKFTSTLTSTLAAFRERNASIAVIRNPRVGDLLSLMNSEEKNEAREKFFIEIEKKGFISTFYIDDKDALNKESLKAKDIDPSRSIAICLNKDSLQKYISIFGEKGALFTLVTDGRSLRRAITGQKIILSDNFNKCDRNIDYLQQEDESFSEDNLFFADEGFAGFSDYSIVGKDYNESGFAPYAVVIHIVYHDTDNSLRIHHFVSESNETINDPANKFFEALQKYHEWNQEHHLNTYAAQEFERLFQDGQYPGLGSIKKLSIMHHLELVNRYLEGVNS